MIWGIPESRAVVLLTYTVSVTSFCELLSVNFYSVPDFDLSTPKVLSLSSRKAYPSSWEESLQSLLNGEDGTRSYVGDSVLLSGDVGRLPAGG